MSKLIYKQEDIKKLQEKLKNIQNIKLIKIATAFISNTSEVKDFLNDLSNKISCKENFEIYLSADFSPDNKSEILSFLKNIANVYIIHNLHAKAYYISGEEEIFAFGSSNLTNNGFANNLELMELKENENNEEILGFFKYCKENATLLNENLQSEFKEIDNMYKNLERNSEIKALNSKIKALKNKLMVKVNDKYDNLEEYYFNRKDYETFNSSNSQGHTIELQKRRNEVKAKLLKLNQQILSELETKYKLYNHWNKSNITSSSIPCKYNNYSLKWLGVRYLRKEVKEIVSSLRLDKKYDAEIHASAFTCFQIDITSEGLEIGIFHSVPSLSYDKENVIKYIENDKNGIKKKFVEVIENLKHQKLKFSTYNKEIENNEFDIDSEDSNEFCKWYLNAHRYNCYSSIMYKYKPDDIRIKDLTDIKNIILEKIQILTPLYELLISKK